jgi:hypothetical protein
MTVTCVSRFFDSWYYNLEKPEFGTDWSLRGLLPVAEMSASRTGASPSGVRAAE